MIEFNFNEKRGCFPNCKGIYAIKGKYNNFYLVGQTLQIIKNRLSQHRQRLRKNNHDNPYLQNSFNKHTENEFCFVFLEECSDPNKIDERECFWIKQLDSMKGKNGWNLREGGAYGLYSKELRKKVSDGIKNSPLAKASREARSKTYTLKSPIGNIITFTNRNRFCKTHKLNNGGIWCLINKKRGITQYKGWTLP